MIKEPFKYPNQSISMPGYRGIVAVDAEDFTKLSSVEHEVIARTVPEILESSFDRAGLAAIWNDREFPATRGDGYVFGFDPSMMPHVIDPWLKELQGVLSDFALGPIPMRLRVSLHIGPLPAEGLEHDGNGTPRNDTHRLLNADQLKAILAEASPHVTRVAAILSGRCYEDAVLSRRTLHPDHFVEVSATVKGKRFEQRAWIHLPTPSGNLLDRRLMGEPPPDDEPPSPGMTSRSPAPDDKPPPSFADQPGRQAQVVNQFTRGNLNNGVIHGNQAITHFS
ncbi:hypothetical protein [Streptosporangium sp. NBC_01469]|uniref:hypothetical protein n=1 Tax=Streptosporangium sp. NBC_01469 TaxID=2903898 RepID=UPI002E2E2BF0|nr:hypothetical protein [Streptosporangium sp. NBC_01469]